ncbi:MAG: hypothetical protein AAF384_09510 [Pseudomonadota bacterium]
MADPSRMSVAKRLANLGLKKTLIAVPKNNVYNVNRVKSLDGNVELTRIASFSSDHVPIIGRVGVPDPQLGIPWKKSMPFYGKWFDDIGGTDPGYQLRRNISSMSHDSMLEQIGRDDQYALVGSYYSVFQTIMKVKRRAPLVLIDDTYLPLVSFPVILPKIGNDEIESKLLNVLKIMLKPDVEEANLESTAGIEVSEG